MNIFHKVTLRSLKENKTRTVVTIIGILLSTAMICAVTTFAASMQDYLLRAAIYNTGDWHARVSGTDISVYQSIASSDEVAAAVYLQRLGFALAEGCTNEYKPYLYIAGGSAGYENILPIHISAGEYPRSETELLLPDHLAVNGGVVYHIGDTLTLTLGTRMLDGEPVDFFAPVYRYDENGQDVLTGETLQPVENRTYTVVGFYSRLPYEIENISFPGYTAITAADGEASPSYCYDVYFKLKHGGGIYDFMSQNNLTGAYNSNVLMFQGVSGNQNFRASLLILSAIVIILIMFGSIALIYNAFAISVSERTRQFGLLSSVGATRKQLRRMVLFEAFCVSSIGIPAGILSGIAGIAVTLHLLGSRFTSWFGIRNVPMRVHVSLPAILSAAVIALITVLLSARIPSRRATKVSAVSAIRQNQDISNARPARTSRLTRRLFGLPGILASKYYKRSRKKYRTTVISLFLSIVLFVSASAFSDYLVEAFLGTRNTEGFDLLYSGTSYSLGGNSPESMLALLCSGEHITAGTYAVEKNIRAIIPNEYLDAEILEELSRPDERFSKTAGMGPDMSLYSVLPISLHFIADSEFKALLAQYHLDETAFMDPAHPLALTVDGNTFYSHAREKYISTNILNAENCPIMGTFIPDDTEETAENPVISYPLYTGRRIYESPYYVFQDGFLQMLYPISLYEYVLPEEARDNYPATSFFLLSDDHGASYTSLSKLLTENGLSHNYLFDYAESAEENRNMVLSIQVFAYGFVVLISLIAAANVFNTISTNISLRRREFAMLRSVGMTEKGFRKMMNYECLLYGSRALLTGLPVSCGVTWLIYFAITKSWETTFHIPWGAMAGASLSVFFVVFITMLYSMKKVQRENLIDGLKNENL